MHAWIDGDCHGQTGYDSPIFLLLPVITPWCPPSLFFLPSLSDRIKRGLFLLPSALVPSVVFSFIIKRGKGYDIRKLAGSVQKPLWLSSFLPFHPRHISYWWWASKQLNGCETREIFRSRKGQLGWELKSVYAGKSGRLGAMSWRSQPTNYSARSQLGRKLCWESLPLLSGLFVFDVAQGTLLPTEYIGLYSFKDRLGGNSRVRRMNMFVPLFPFHLHFLVVEGLHQSVWDGFTFGVFFVSRYRDEWVQVPLILSDRTSIGMDKVDHVACTCETRLPVDSGEADFFNRDNRSLNKVLCKEKIVGVTFLQLPYFSVIQIKDCNPPTQFNLNKNRHFNVTQMQKRLKVVEKRWESGSGLWLKSPLNVDGS